MLAELDNFAQVLSRANLNIHEALQIRANVANAFFRGTTLIGMHQKFLELQLDELILEAFDQFVDG